MKRGDKMINEKRYKLNVIDHDSMIKDHLDEVELNVVNNNIITNIEKVKNALYVINPNEKKSDLEDYLNN